MDSLVHDRGGFPYAQVIGWLRLIHDGPGPCVKAYTYKLPQKRFQRRFRQERYEWQGKEFELDFDYSELSNLDIADEIRSEIVRTTAKGGSLQGRWLDLACFDYMTVVIDWRSRLGLPRL
ncbi:hypothetical protein EV188_107109 [Actinomycetospora succinea]|uniref:Uncharacterized protein n=2 Tax=Actinomycetospora succinea TaxID=663603 RepID=A0A4R6UYW2_9PSEU|nr:hypothetical protein EV188_107109 [Actinomycetospora succinea]